jgi:hypothetical protein
LRELKLGEGGKLMEKERRGEIIQSLSFFLFKPSYYKVLPYIH